MANSEKLNTWIAESESWQSYIDFQLPEEEKAKYKFLPPVSYTHLDVYKRQM